jgi:signal transduction histidine kinase
VIFARARRRLTLAYIVMFALVLGIFSLAFLALIAIVLEPNFDLAPDTSSDQAAQIAYDAAVERIGFALVAADLVAIAVVGGGAWLLAARTLRPIHDAHERQRRFVADASHEMRTPLTAIRATTENALRPGTPGAAQLAALETAATAAADLARLTSDLLTLAQSDDATLRPITQQFDLSVVVAERLTLRTAAGATSPTTVHFASDLVVDGDPDEIGRICDNLLDNAFRYGGTNVHVSVTTQAVDRQAVLEIADDGPGIALADQAHIFEPFYRVHADATAPPGSGLGLAIATAMARRNRGRLTVESRPERGTVFELYLPRVA